MWKDFLNFLTRSTAFSLARFRSEQTMQSEDQLLLLSFVGLFLKGYM